MILTKRSTTQDSSSKVQDLGPTYVLAYPELWHELPTASRARVLLDCYVETPFSVYKSGYVRLQPFLLIDRTCRVITALYVHARIVLSGCITTFSELVAQDTYGVPSI